MVLCKRPSELAAQPDALAEEFVQAVVLDSEYLVVMVRECAKFREKCKGRAAARAAV